MCECDLRKSDHGLSQVLAVALKLTPHEQIRLIQALLQSLAQVLQDKDMSFTSEDEDGRA